MKTVISIVLIVLLTFVNVLVNYVRFSWTILFDPNYWIGLCLTQIPIVIIIFVARSLFKSRELSHNEEYKKSKGVIDRAYDTIHTTAGYLRSFKEYIGTDNRNRKLEAYTAILERKLLRYENTIAHITAIKEARKQKLELRARKRSLLKGKDRSAEERNPIARLRITFLNRRFGIATAKKTLCETRKAKACEIIEFVKVRCSKVSYANLFTDREKADSDNNDLTIHEKRDVTTLIGTKILGLISIGIMFGSSVLFNVTGTPWEILYALTITFLQTALAIYTGASSGVMFIRREVNLRMRLRVAYLQEFFGVKKDHPKFVNEDRSKNNDTPN